MPDGRRQGADQGERQRPRQPEIPGGRPDRGIRYGGTRVRGGGVVSHGRDIISPSPRSQGGGWEFVLPVAGNPRGGGRIPPLGRAVGAEGFADE
ncbi:hypothetical protein GCM10018781_04780 [Kitasatospora indigofera]|uniref:Uncharacterized protein n=1 Tax=Kitasatospora indigofera TaxID=67307 RepID=A0A919KJR9_9ACTN|nr:hypothetical protein GCM10018781_04780 [Kitasatospora indigofera]